MSYLDSNMLSNIAGSSQLVHLGDISSRSLEHATVKLRSLNR
jgi:hypothetical protein